MRNKNKTEIFFPMLNCNNLLYNHSYGLVSIKYDLLSYYNKYYISNNINSVFFFYYIALKKVYSNVSYKKFRKNISYSNVKVRNQKGLGRARLGSKKSPLLKGGSSLFVVGRKISRKKIPKKIFKSVIFLLLINKRAYIIISILFPHLHFFETLENCLKKQIRILGGVLKPTFVYLFFYNILNDFFSCTRG